MDLVFRHFWLAFVVVTVVNGMVAQAKIKPATVGDLRLRPGTAVYFLATTFGPTSRGC